MEQLRSTLLEIVREVEPTASVSDERNFEMSLKELGVDSLDAMLLFLKVQERFGLDEIPEKDLDRLKTLNDIAAYVSAAEKKNG